MARSPTPAPLSGKTLMGRFVVLEALVVALGAAEISTKSDEQVKSFTDELRKDAEARAAVLGHAEIGEEAKSYIDETIAAMVAASST